MRFLPAWPNGRIVFWTGSVLVGLVVFLAGMGVQAYWSPLPTSGNSAGGPAPAPDVAARGAVPEWLGTVRRHSGDKGIGDPDAPVTITEYTDFQCPFCARHSRRAFPRIVREFVVSGDVYYRIRHFPLSRMHPRAVPAALASECAANQEAFWPYKELLMRNQDRLSGKVFLQLARTAGVPDPERFRACLTDQKPMSTVRAEFREAQERGVRATPTLFVGDEEISGAQPYRKIQEVIRRQLDA